MGIHGPMVEVVTDASSAPGERHAHLAERSPVVLPSGPWSAAPLRHEEGPSEHVTLQWATCDDAADQAGISRLYGGIHISPRRTSEVD